MVKAPDFSLPDQTGTVRSLHDYAGKLLVLYFYPKDDTPGCTTEACAFRDGREILESMGAAVVGVSKDSVRAHASFAKKYNLNFTLLSDPDHKVIEAYDSWALKRNTFLISPSGGIIKKYEGVDPSTHIGEIMKDIKETVSN